jgi:2-polyprenyl-6-methoxyphenol hydroxylase-like FAD-dependent oxidoreductase
MSGIVIVGGGVIGLSTGLMLAGAGHEVTVLEHNPAPVPASPGEAWRDWERAGVAQFRQPHYLHPPARRIFDDHLPGVTTVLLGARAATLDLLSLMPPPITDRAPRDGDEKFVTVTGRRPVVEYAVASVAGDRLDIRRGVTVAGLLTGPPDAAGIPNVTGVRTADGAELPADLVIDAMGRRSRLPDWLEAIGARRPEEEAEDSAFTYYTRFFRSPDGRIPGFRSALNTEFDSYSLLTLPGDAGVWSVTIYIASHDAALKGLRDLEQWTALVAACPRHAHLLDGEPITGVMAMGGIADRRRRLVVSGAPVATGVVAVGDSWACTNPSRGRGITMGLMHAAGTTEVIGRHLGQPAALALAHHEMTETTVAPWYEDTVALGRAHRERINASIEGRPPAGTPRPGPVTGREIALAMTRDPDVFRAALEMTSMLALPGEIMTRPGFAERVKAAAAADDAAGPGPAGPPGPSRDDLLRRMALA